MPEYSLYGTEIAVALDATNTVGIFPGKEITTNQTRSTLFSPDMLVKWAKAVEDAYGAEARVVFTPERPMLATHPDEDALIGIAVAPREEL